MPVITTLAELAELGEKLDAIAWNRDLSDSETDAAMDALEADNPLSVDIPGGPLASIVNLLLRDLLRKAVNTECGPHQLCLHKYLKFMYQMVDQAEQEAVLTLSLQNSVLTALLDAEDFDATPGDAV